MLTRDAMLRHVQSHSNKSGRLERDICPPRREHQTRARTATHPEAGKDNPAFEFPDRIGYDSSHRTAAISPATLGSFSPSSTPSEVGETGRETAESEGQTPRETRSRSTRGIRQLSMTPGEIDYGPPNLDMVEGRSACDGFPDVTDVDVALHDRYDREIPTQFHQLIGDLLQPAKQAMYFATLHHQWPMVHAVSWDRGQQPVTLQCAIGLLALIVSHSEEVPRMARKLHSWLQNFLLKRLSNV